MSAKTPTDVAERTAAAKARGTFPRFEYTERDANGNLDAVYCRVTGAKIKGWVDFENQPDGKIRQRFQQLGNYTEVTFELNDGTLMHVAVSQEGAGRLRNPNVWADIMAVELDAWARSIVASNMPQEFMDKFMAAHSAKAISRVVE